MCLLSLIVCVNFPSLLSALCSLSHSTHTYLPSPPPHSPLTAASEHDGQVLWQAWARGAAAQRVGQGGGQDQQGARPQRPQGVAHERQARPQDGLRAAALLHV